MSRSLTYPKKLILFLYFFSLTLFIFISGRWIFLGSESIGRLWIYYVSYFDIGFSRRAFIGTIIDVLIIKDFISPVYFAWSINIFAILIFLILVHDLVKKHINSKCYLVIILLFSPFSIPHFAYNVGTLDLFLVLILLLALKCDGLFSRFILCVVGILIHEIFIFFIPFIFLSKISINFQSVYLYRNEFLLFLLLTLIFLYVVSSHPKISYSDYIVHISSLIPIDYRFGDLWSGRYELFSNIDSNVKRSVFSELDKSFSVIFSLSPILFIMIILLIFKVPLHVSFLSLLPLIASFFASDFARWVSFSGFLLVTSIVYNNHTQRFNFNGSVLSLLFLFFGFFCALGGGDINRPYPIVQFLTEYLI